MLAEQGIIAAADAAADRRGSRRRSRAEIAGGRFNFSRALEDIHMNIEARLTELIGEPAGRLHTARSRNDQVATDFRLWVRDAIDDIDAQLHGLQQALADKAEAHAGTVMPGFTHLQSAQPVTFGHHLLAYVEMLARDRGRFADARRRLNEMPARRGGARRHVLPDRPAARRRRRSASTGRRRIRSTPSSDRDFALEALAAASICAVHLSRFAEEIVHLVHARSSASSGSRTASPPAPRSCRRSAIRTRPSWCAPRPGGSSARCTALLIVMKGLPLAYSKDMQEDKEQVFDALPTPVALASPR